MSIDLAIIAAYLVGTTLFGCSFYFRKGRDSSDEFTKGGGRLPGWALALSVFATYVSSISFLALPAKAYLQSWNVLVLSFSIPFAATAAAIWFVPFYRRQTSVSAYSFLEARFGVWARLYASGCFLVMQSVRSGMILFLLALLLKTLMGFSVPVVICVVGFATMLYSMMGGLNAVVWTDAIQAVILIGGALVCLVVLGCTLPDGFAAGVRTAFDAGKLSLGSFSMADWGSETFWVIFVYGVFLNLQNFGIDQSYTQRYVAAKSDREAVKSMFSGAMLYVPVSAVFVAIGTLLWVWVKGHPGVVPEDVLAQSDAVFPWFIVHRLPHGVSGLLVAAIIAAAMSTVSATLNSGSTVLLEDYRKRFAKGEVAQVSQVRFLRLATLGLGVFSVGVALAVMNVTSVMTTWWALQSVLSGGMLGLFLLGAFARRTRPAQAAVATVVGVLAVFWVVFGEKLGLPHLLHVNLAMVVGTLALVLVGFFLATLTKGGGRTGPSKRGVLAVALATGLTAASAAAYSPKPSEPFYQQAARSHTGIPSIAVSPRNGRLWLTCYCAWKGGECAYNYVPLMTSADGGKTWKDVLVVDPDGEGPLRAFDPELFVNGAGKLVWSWTERACNPENPLDGCFADPKGDRLMFVEIDAENEPAAPYPEARFACRGVMMCKPIRLADGRTLLPLSHWFDEPSACFYATKDWRTFDFLGGAKLPKEIRQFDEHSVIQCADGSLKTWIRTDHEPRESVSTDGGRTWSEPVVSQVGNPNSRLYCTKLRNGHLLMVKHGKMGEHFEQKGWLPRRELRAFVSDDEGRTWKGDLIIDERTKGLSYPDGDVAADGSVYLTYDCDRMRAGEILVARITEQDVLAGKLVSEGSYLRRVASSRTIHRPETASGMEVLPLGAIRPEGWLRTQLELQRDGLTGHAEELYDDIGRSAWLGVKGGDGWERGPYYAKGLVALGLTLGDAALTAKAKKWIDAIVGSQRENGDFGPRNDNWWANMPALCAVRDWGAATGDARVVPFLRRYFRYQFDRLREHPLMSDSYWAAARAGDNMEVVIWLERKTGEEWLTALADLMATQSADWETYYRRGGDGGGQFGFRQHIVNFMQGLKEPALAWSIGHAGSTGIKAYSAAFDPNGWAMRQHGRVDRMLNGTELLAGRDAYQGTELCATAERILSCQSVLATCGWFGAGLAEADDLESVAYNTLPSTLADDGRGVRYYQLLNMPRCGTGLKFGFENHGDGGAVVPGPDAGFGCCRSNFHFAWPKFVQSMWMKGGFHMGGGLVALAYGPCTVSNELATIVEGGTYPFGDMVTMKFVRTNGKAWPFTPRRPRWCADRDMVVKLNGEVVSRTRHGQIVRTWAAGDELEITFGAKVTVEQGAGGALAVRRGALVYALKIDAEVKPLGTKPGREGYPAREYAPKSPWNYALVSDGRGLAAEYVAPTDLSGNVFAHGRAPSALKVKAYRTDYAGWGTFRADGHFNGRAQEPPPSPIEKSVLTGEPEEITLVPLGSTQIRITLFPWTR